MGASGIGTGAATSSFQYVRKHIPAEKVLEFGITKKINDESENDE